MWKLRKLLSFERAGGDSRTMIFWEDRWKLKKLLSVDRAGGYSKRCYRLGSLSVCNPFYEFMKNQQLLSNYLKQESMLSLLCLYVFKEVVLTVCALYALYLRASVLLPTWSEWVVRFLYWVPLPRPPSHSSPSSDYVPPLRSPPTQLSFEQDLLQMFYFT